ncbi:UNVERIFIED_CONTAM: hypothetical protein GTU68_050646 [Idotea baltica]|nr:hypothetical protein [Idotea baltica]
MWILLGFFCHWIS